MVDLSWLRRTLDVLLVSVATLLVGVGCAGTCRRGDAPAPETPTVSAPEVTPVAPDDRMPEALAGTIPLGGPCGPNAGDCDASGYCAFPSDGACGDGAVAGVCTARPRGCFKDCPGVCGCDGVRYCNACVAQGRGHSVRHAGACADAPGPLTP